MLINLGYRRYIIFQLKVSSCTLSRFLATFDTGGEILLNKEVGSIKSYLGSKQRSHPCIVRCHWIQNRVILYQQKLLKLPKLFFQKVASASGWQVTLARLWVTKILVDCFLTRTWSITAAISSSYNLVVRWRTHSSSSRCAVRSRKFCSVTNSLILWLRHEIKIASCIKSISFLHSLFNYFLTQMFIMFWFFNSIIGVYFRIFNHQQFTVLIR